MPASPDPGSGLRLHRLRAILPELPEGEHLLRLRVERDGGAPAERTAGFLGPAGAGTRMLQVYNFPNPFEDRTEFIYRLSRSAESARLTLYTLSGRKIWSTEGPARANDHAIAWDGRDADGDEVANGVYLYKLEIRTTEGRTLRRIERIARIR